MTALGRSFFGVPISPASPVVWGATPLTVFSAWRVSSHDKRHGLICLLGGQNSFAATERLLKECCGWTISDERIRQACQAESPRIADFRAESPAVAKAFADAPGDVEFQTDAAKVNTTEGWRDMKIGSSPAVSAAKPSTPEDWDNRHLPAPTTRVAFAAIETIDDFAPAGVNGRSGWELRIGARSPSWETVPNGSGTLRRGSSLVAPKFWIYTTLPSTSPTRHGAGSVKERRRRKNGWTGAAACCCLTAGLGSATIWDRRWQRMTPPRTAPRWTI